MSFIENLLQDIKCDERKNLLNVWLLKNGKNIFELRLLSDVRGIEHINITVVNPYHGTITNYDISTIDIEDTDGRKCITGEIQGILNFYK